MPCRPTSRAVHLRQTVPDHLCALTAAVCLAQERERRQLADDLHDGPCQLLSLAKVKLEAMQARTPTTCRDEMNELIALVDEAARATRSLIFQLSPPILRDLGLAAALQWLSEDISQRYRMAVTFHQQDGADVADEAVRILLFRSVRELLINAAKYAGVERVMLRLQRVRNHTRISVADRGRGFDPAQLAAMPAMRRGFGLSSIGERIEHLHGRMIIHSAPGRGTLITLEVPAAQGASQGRG